MHKRIQRAYISIFEKTCTKFATINSNSQLDIIIAKATSPNDLHLLERYVWELTIIFSTSPSSSRNFAISFTRRYGQTRCWRVALKCLLLLHLLLRTLPNDHPFRNDILSARANALITFYPCHFRDETSMYSNEYTKFVSSYACLIDKVIDCNYGVNEGESCTTSPSSPSPSPMSEISSEICEEKLKEASKALELVQGLQSLMDRAMECVPVGHAAMNFIVRSAMKQIARESFMSYLAARKGLSKVLDSILQMAYHNCIEGLVIYKRAAEQAVRLGEFYTWCKHRGFCGQYEYPLIDKIPKIQVMMLEAFVEQTWQLPESTSSSTSSSSSNEVEMCRKNEVVITQEWEKFEDESEDVECEVALIDFEDEEVNWEVMLDDCAKRSRNDRGRDEIKSWTKEDENDEKSLQIFNPHLFNPFFWT